MTKSRVFFLIVVVGIAFGIVLLYLMPRKDMVVEQYTSYSNATQREAFSHGMIPDFLPESAKNIVSRRDLDLNTLEVIFDYSGDEFVKFLGRQKKSTGIETEELLKYVTDVIETSDPEVLIVIPKVASPDIDSQGALIVNTKQKRAVYFRSK